jgi:hypothetical protein
MRFDNIQLSRSHTTLRAWAELQCVRLGYDESYILMPIEGAARTGIYVPFQVLLQMSKKHA